MTYGASRVTIRAVTDRPTFVLAAMAAAGADARFDPVRLQKYFFLLDRELDGKWHSPYFDFQPDEYGPFDRAVYVELEDLARAGLAVVDARLPYRIYGLTDEGFERGKRNVANMPTYVRDYLARASNWVLSLDLRELLEAIYEYAPDMAGRAALPASFTPTREEATTHPFLRGMARAFDWPVPSRVNPSSRENGANALGRVWAEVGGYIRDAMDRTRPTVEGS